MSYLEMLPKIKTLAFDVDGVLTDGSVKIMEDGSVVRSLNSRDGFAIQLAVKMGFEVIVITGGSSVAVKNSLNALGVDHVYLGSSNKIDVFEEHCLAFGTTPETTLYMGDDIPDYKVLQEVGIAACPNDAAPEIKTICSLVSTINGGEGCARDVIEQTLKAQNKWFNNEDNFKKFTW